jgi:phosphate transport system permease protein
MGERPDSAALEPSLERSGFPLGDVLFKGVAVAASAFATALLGVIAYKIFDLAAPAMSHFGLAFLWTEVWDPVKDNYGALTFVYGTAVTSLIALVLATPISIAIALFLTEIAPRRIRTPVATLIELLAAIPSVVLGLWGILVFGPWLRDHLSSGLQRGFGWIPLFEEPATDGAASVLTASLVLTIMIVPITSAICRELFSRVPKDLMDGAMALGTTRWEAVRSVLLAYAAPGIAAAVLLGLGRAFGEAIAITQVIGGSDRLTATLFAPGDTLGSRIASQYQGATSALQQGSLLYLAAILMVISLVTNVAAQFVVRRFERQRRSA